MSISISSSFNRSMKVENDKTLTQTLASEVSSSLDRGLRPGQTRMRVSSHAILFSRCTECMNTTVYFIEVKT